MYQHACAQTCTRVYMYASVHVFVCRCNLSVSRSPRVCRNNDYGLVAPIVSRTAYCKLGSVCSSQVNSPQQKSHTTTGNGVRHPRVRTDTTSSRCSFFNPSQEQGHRTTRRPRGYLRGCYHRVFGVCRERQDSGDGYQPFRFAETHRT